MLDLSLGERLFYTTVKLSSQKGGITESTGTGFFFAFARKQESRLPAIITNKHVIDGYEKVVAICHIEKDGKPSGEFARFFIEINDNNVIRHPDPKIDLCAVMIGGLIHQAQQEGKSLYCRELDANDIPAAQDWKLFDGMEEVTMLGCPNGISDEVNNLPIARRGITASPLSKDYNGKPEFMVDMACFPGSSGSPIFIYDRDGYRDKKSNSYKMGMSRVLLVGVLYAGPLISNTGEIILAKAPTFQMSAMMHLGNAIRATALLDLESEVLKKVNPQR